MKSTFFLFFLLLSTLVSVHGQAMQKPLLMEGKKTLYQRVLSVPDAKLYSQPDALSSAEDVVPFSVFYVYRREPGWLQVGNDSFGRINGWVPLETNDCLESGTHGFIQGSSGYAARDDVP